MKVFIILWLMLLPLFAGAQQADSAINTNAPNSILIEKANTTSGKKFVLKEGRKVWIAQSLDAQGKPILVKATITKIEDHQITFQSVANPGQKIIHQDSTLRFIAFTTAGRVTIALFVNSICYAAGIAGCVLTIGLVAVQVAMVVLYPVLAIFGMRGLSSLSLNFRWVPGTFRMFTQLFKVKVPLEKKFIFPDAKWRARLAHT